MEWRVEAYWYVLDDSSPFEDVVVEEIVLRHVAHNMNASVDLEIYLAIIDRYYVPRTRVLLKFPIYVPLNFSIQSHC